MCIRDRVQEGIKFFNPSSHNTKKCRKRVLIITQKIDYSGGTLAAVYAAMALKDRGMLVVLSAPDGNKTLINEMTGEGITVSICSSLPYIFEQHKKWIQEFDIVIVNLFTMIECAYEVIPFRPVLWWIHEASLIYELMHRKMPYISNKVYTDAINIYAVSEIAQQNFNVKYDNLIKNTLKIGIPDTSSHENINKKHDKKMIFAIIGAIHSLKLQHIFLYAAMAINDNEKIEFWIIGKSYDDEYFEKVMSMSAAMSSVRMFGEMSRADIRKAFADIDVCVCASSEETLSMSIIEGMMYGKVCITTSNTGIAAYIQNGVNGFVIPSDNAVALAETMQWIIDSSDQAEEIGKAARKTYEKYFTLKVFGEKLEEILDETEKKWKDKCGN